MSHARQQILNALAAEVTGLSITEDRVFLTVWERSAIPAEQVPCLALCRQPGTFEISDHDADDKLTREARFVVKAIVRAAEDVEVELEKIIEQVEGAVSRTLGGLVTDCVPVETRLDLPGQADAETAALSVVYRVTYRTAIGAPSTIV